MAIRNEKPALVIMAAGMGSRFGGLKQIAPIGIQGEPILAFSLYDAEKAGFRKFIFVIKDEMKAEFRRMIISKIPKAYETEVVFQRLADIPSPYSVPSERVKPWGTGHAILSCLNVIKGPFAVINSDDYYGPGAFGPVYKFLETAEENEYCMMAYKLSNTLSENGGVSRGVCETSGDFLSKITETHEITRETKLSPDTPVSMNLWGFTPGFLDTLKNGFPKFLEETLPVNPLKGEYLLPTIVAEELAAGHVTVRVLRTDDVWYGVTYKEDLPAVCSKLRSYQRQGLYPEQLL